MKKSSRKERVNFLLEDRNYHRLSLVIYLCSVLVILSIYFTTLMIFSKTSANYFITGLSSVLIGVYLVFHKDKIIKKISLYLHDKKVKNNKREGKEGLQRTLKRISPKNHRLKLKIKGKVSLKEKIEGFKERFGSSKAKVKDYIEYREK